MGLCPLSVGYASLACLAINNPRDELNAHYVSLTSLCHVSTEYSFTTVERTLTFLILKTFELSVLCSTVAGIVTSYIRVAKDFKMSSRSARLEDQGREIRLVS